MINNFGWSLNIIGHSDTKTVENTSDNKKRKSTATGSAHYYGNWNKGKQDKYNAWHYQNNKDKWGVKDSNTATGSSEADYQAYVKEHGGEDSHEWLGKGGDFTLEKMKDGSLAVLNGNKLVMKNDQAKKLDKKKVSAYLTKAYGDAGDYLKKKGIFKRRKAYLKKVGEYNITDLTPSDRNAFYKYYHPKKV